MTRWHAEDVMTADVVVVGESAGFKEIAETMARRRVSGLPVVDEDGAVVGVVTQSDLIRKEEFKDERRTRRLQTPHARREHAKAAATIARDLMSTPAFTVAPERSVVEVVRLMLHHDVHRLPVVDAGNRLVGIVSRADVLKIFARDDRDLAGEIDREIVARHFSGNLVHVDVRDGVVTLDGQIEQKSLIPLAVRLVQSVDGVVDVVDHLSYTIDDTHPAQVAHLPHRAPTPAPRF